MSNILNLDPFECPGYIVCDKNMNRLKIMGRQYIAAVNCMEFKNPSFGVFNLTADNLESRDIGELFRVKEIDIFLRNFPKWNPIATNIEEKMKAMYQQIAQEFQNLNPLHSNAKDFAKNAKDFSHDSILFALFHRQVCSIEEYFAVGAKSGGMQFFHELGLLSK